jgi:hypothetical protein
MGATRTAGSKWNESFIHAGGTRGLSAATLWGNPPGPCVDLRFPVQVLATLVERKPVPGLLRTALIRCIDRHCFGFLRITRPSQILLGVDLCEGRTHSGISGGATSLSQRRNNATPAVCKAQQGRCFTSLVLRSIGRRVGRDPSGRGGRADGEPGPRRPPSRLTAEACGPPARGERRRSLRRLGHFARRNSGRSLKHSVATRLWRSLERLSQLLPVLIRECFSLMHRFPRFGSRSNTRTPRRSAKAAEPETAAPKGVESFGTRNSPADS